MLTPIVRLMLLAGVGHKEFDSIAKRVFVTVASKEYGLRGRPTNTSRISAMTGVSRKEVARLRESPVDSAWTPANVLSPAASVIHYWHHDPEYSVSPGEPLPLPFQGPHSFSTLVSRYAGDVPPGAVRASLFQGGIVEEDANGMLIARRRTLLAPQLDETMIGHVCFSMTNLANTITHNLRVTGDQTCSDAAKRELLYLERTAFTDHISPEATVEFRNWVKAQGGRFIEAADAELGERETPKGAWTSPKGAIVGVGVFFFQTERHS